MNPRSHPDDSLIGAYALGDLPTAVGLTVSAHLEACTACRQTAARKVEIAGARLLEMPGAAMASDAFEAVLRRIDGAEPEPKPVRPAHMPGVALPCAVAGLGVSPKRWFGRGAWVAHTKASDAQGWRSFLLSLPAGGRLPEHAHSGAEYTVVLEGVFTDGEGRHGPGDFVYGRADDRHRISVPEGARCICLVAAQGALKWSSPWVGLTRPWTGI